MIFVYLLSSDFTSKWEILKAAVSCISRLLTKSAATLSIMTLNVMTFSIRPLSIMTFCITINKT